MASEQTMHQQAISLVGKTIEAATKMGERLEGVVSNAMFDSMLVETKHGKKILCFDDIAFLRQISQAK